MEQHTNQKSKSVKSKQCVSLHDFYNGFSLICFYIERVGKNNYFFHQLKKYNAFSSFVFFHGPRKNDPQKCFCNFKFSVFRSKLNFLGAIESHIK